MPDHSSILAWEILWIEEPVGYSLWGCKESDMTEHTHIHACFPHTHFLLLLITDWREKQSHKMRGTWDSKASHGGEWSPK